MELKDQVCTLEQAKTMAKLGLNQYANFYWLINNDGECEFKTRSEVIEICTDAVLETKKEDAGIEEGQPHSYDEAAFREAGIAVFKNICSLPDNEAFFAAYTASELGEMLPCESGIIYWDVMYNDHIGEWYCSIHDLVKELKKEKEVIAHEAEGDTMAEAMADALIHCLENKLLTQ